MPTAYVLLNTEIGAEHQVLKDLRSIEGIREVYNLWGIYDIIVNVNAETIDALKNIINRQIAKIAKINSKLTMIVDEEKPPALKTQVFVDPDMIIA
ncbi:MAG: Lrp/AsnC ligand binding domain-containing protein [Candidatus Bathyarchaeota archaeon]|nr:Lrp/AsnC ligand binding domain-containing protein [Candidatus Bathyarchaeota archaeon]